jgi:hypothetical protein
VTEFALPPKSALVGYRNRQIHPMTREQAKYWLASYNAWADEWRKAELSRDLPLNPDWKEASFSIHWNRPSIMSFAPLPLERRLKGLMRVKKWDHSERFSRRAKPALVDNVMWACWLVAA